MSEVFEGLDKLGFSDLGNIELFKKEQPVKKDKSSQPAALSIADILYDKSYTCPACDKPFKEKAIRRGKTRLVGTDTDLMPTYDPIDPILYDVVLCSNCGYAAISQKFEYLSVKQGILIKQEITSKFKPRIYPELFTVDIAIERYKLALLNCVVKGSTLGERAYVCLKLAWLFRSANNQEKERKFIENALSGFKSAFESERLPICGMDEYTLIYIIAELSRRMGDNSTAMQWFSRIITSRTVNQRLKDKAIDQKNLLRSTLGQT